MDVCWQLRAGDVHRKNQSDPQHALRACRSREYGGPVESGVRADQPGEIANPGQPLPYMLRSVSAEIEQQIFRDERHKLLTANTSRLQVSH
jgi:hypothetical protein